MKLKKADSLVSTESHDSLESREWCMADDASMECIGIVAALALGHHPHGHQWWRARNHWLRTRFRD
jgi:hypothetical protein